MCITNIIIKDKSETDDTHGHRQIDDIHGHRQTDDTHGHRQTDDTHRDRHADRTTHISTDRQADR